MKFIKNNLANLLTLTNLFSGCIAVIFLLEGKINWAAICILVALLCDFLDGFVARLLRANSPLGIQLDSLADMVTFGFLPGLSMYVLLLDHWTSTGSQGFPYPFLGFLITLASCLRLAIFNIDTEQTNYFKGLNTPTNTILIFGLLYAIRYKDSFLDAADQVSVLIALTLVSSYLLISPIKMFSLKLKTFDLKSITPHLLVLLISIILLITLGVVALPLIVGVYVLISLLFQRSL